MKRGVSACFKWWTNIVASSNNQAAVHRLAIPVSNLLHKIIAQGIMVGTKAAPNVTNQNCLIVYVAWSSTTLFAT